MEKLMLVEINVVPTLSLNSSLMLDFGFINVRYGWRHNIKPDRGTICQPGLEAWHLKLISCWWSTTELLWHK